MGTEVIVGGLGRVGVVGDPTTVSRISEKTTEISCIISKEEKSKRKTRTYVQTLHV